MTPDHQCEPVNIETNESDSPKVVATVETELKSVTEEKLELPELIKERDGLMNVLIAKKQQESEEGERPKCWNCEAMFTLEHRCWKG